MSEASKQVVIASAARTPVGTFLGAFSNTPAHVLGEVVLREVLSRAKVPANDVSEVILGQILCANQGQNPARQASVNAGIPHETPAWGMNQLCGSGLRAVALGAQQILTGDSTVVIAGGQENMTMAPHVTDIRQGVRMGSAVMKDTMIDDCLMDAFHNIHMGVTAENVAREFQITREDQDAFAADSQQKAQTAMQAGKFKNEIVPVTIKSRKSETVVDTDEHPKDGVTAEGLGKLRAAFDKDGTVTAGNASGINDGAAAVLMMSAQEAENRGIEPLGRIRAWANSGVDPKIMGTGPIPATRRALERAGWSIDDLELVEANEAFASQAICVNRELGWDTSIVNVNGGAIALGHPVGASGARILVTLLHEMHKRDVKKGLATLCIGGGMGIAMCIERD